MGVGRRVRGEGPLPCEYMVIGEWPGKDEAKSGRVFCGKTGREVDRYLDGVRLPARHAVYLTNFIKEWCGPDADYSQDDFDRDEPELRTEIRAVQPRIIVTLGRHITRYFLGDVDLDETFGIPWYLPIDSPTRELFDHPERVVIFAAYNPAAGFRSPDISARIAYQWAQLEAVLSGELTPRILYDDPIPDPTYTELTTLEEVDAALCDGGRVSTDTEGYPSDPWSVQGTSSAGTAWIIRYKRTDLVARFIEWVNACPELYTFTFHSALHDLAMFRAFGVDTRRLTFDDTMVMAYNLQLEPQGLKPLCARWCNMQMQHFDEIMGDASFQLAQDWLLMVLENEDTAHAARCQAEFVHLTTTPYVDARGVVKPGRKLKVPPKLPKSDLHKSVERCLKSKDPRKLWGDQVLDRHVDARGAYGNMWAATLDHVPLHRALHYAGRDADGTHRLFPQLEERLRANDLWDVYQADLGTVPLIDRMQQIGIQPDLGHFEVLSEDLGFELVEIKTRLAGRLLASAARQDVDAAFDFNPNSTFHVGDLLFEHFSVAALKRTPGGDPSTNDKVLEALEKDAGLDGQVREIVADIREYREVYKLKHTFVDQIPDFVHRWPFDGRIHPTFRITRVVTGRLAASDPNILAMPKHGKFAKRFRQGFVAGPGHLICSWDLSQIELRVLAHLSQDAVLLHAFRTGIDLHATLAERIFGVAPKNQDESKHRLPAKAVNFGIPMGMTAIGLCLELRKNGVDVDEDDAQRWLTETMTLYKDVPVYQQGKIAQAKRYGFVTDIRGRRRYIGGIRSFDDATRSEAERFAFSTPIQAGAQEVMKEAEGYVYTHILLPRWGRGEWVEPLVQIHDDLVVESGVMGEATFAPHPTKPKKSLVTLEDPSLHFEMVHAMTKVPERWLSVPIETSGEAGYTWGALSAIANKAA